MTYVELHASSAFSFLRGASNPEDLVGTAARLDLPALALCDRDGLYGSPRLHSAAKKCGVRAMVGAELTLEDKRVLPVLVANRIGYQNLCRLITEAKLRGTKTESTVFWKELPAYAEGLLVLTGDEEGILREPWPTGRSGKVGDLGNDLRKDNVFVEIQRHLRREETWRNKHLVTLAGARRLPLVATNGVLYAEPERRRVLDLFTCARHHTHFDSAGRLLSINAERHLKSAAKWSAFSPICPRPSKTRRSSRNASNSHSKISATNFRNIRCRPERPWIRFCGQWPSPERGRDIPISAQRCCKQFNFELDLICRLGFSGYFLIVWDIANYCSQNDIFMQGRGSAANSVVCYSLGITACDPIAGNLLFERFLSEGRKTWPDIDLDLPSGDRRERVIQEVYRRYGKHGAAMTANVITYRGRSAMREIGKALNFSPDIIDRFSSLCMRMGIFPTRWP